MPWTQFWDMHSGGGQKLDWSQIFIEASEEEAKVIFYNRFHRNPERVTCTCCGGDYSIEEYADLDQATAYHRGCAYAYFDKEGNRLYPDPNPWNNADAGGTSRWVEEPERSKFTTKPYMTPEEFAQLDWVKIIRADEISDEERQGSVPDEGYVWAGGDDE